MLNNINFLNFKSNSYPPLNALNRNNQSNVIGFKGNNLRPLMRDTISFTSIQKQKTDAEALMAAFHNEEICEQLHNDAQGAKQYLHDTIKKYFDGYIYDKDKNPNGIIEPIQSRVKSPGSIREKVFTKLARDFEPPKDPTVKPKPMVSTFSPYSKEGIKQNIRDVAGCRIVIKDAFDETMNTIVDELCTLITEEELIIEEIENHISKDENAIPYFSEAQLKRIRQAVNDVRLANNLPTIDIKSPDFGTGYMALHLDIDTTNIGRRKDNRGFYSELQILGSDVAMLKDIEDLCYKLKDNKSIKQKHPSFTPFEEFFKQAYMDRKKYPNLEEDYKEYTKKAYLSQRNRRPHNGEAKDDITNWAYTYPTIEECGLKGKIPPILDFNNLARIKRDCDDLLYVFNNPQRVLDDAKKPKGQQ